MTTDRQTDAKPQDPHRKKISFQNVLGLTDYYTQKEKILGVRYVQLKFSFMGGDYLLSVSLAVVLFSPQAPMDWSHK